MRIHELGPAECRSVTRTGRREAISAEPAARAYADEPAMSASPVTSDGWQYSTLPAIQSLGPQRQAASRVHLGLGPWLP
jgi:hypothetical protein